MCTNEILDRAIQGGLSGQDGGRERHVVGYSMQDDGKAERYPSAMTLPPAEEAGQPGRTATRKQTVKEGQSREASETLGGSDFEGDLQC